MFFTHIGHTRIIPLRGLRHHISVRSWLFIVGIVFLGIQPRSYSDETSDRAGRHWPVEWKTFRDSQTGRQVTALTTDPAADDKIYQTHPSWTFDQTWIVFQSQRTGKSQLFAVKEATGHIVQLTAGSQGHGTACLSRRNYSLMMMEGRQVIQADYERTLQSSAEGPESPPILKIVGEVPLGANVSGLPSWDQNEQVFYLSLEWPEEPLERRWSIHALEITTGSFREILRQNFRVNHVQANPYVSGLLMYAQETAGDTEQRMWLARADQSEHRPFYQETYDEWVTHEIWWDENRSLFTIWPKNDEMKLKPHGIASIHIDGTFQVHSQFPYWHVTGAKGARFAVGDTFLGEIFRVDLTTGARTLLTQGHRLQKSGTHPHQTLRPDGRKVLFISHHFGNPDLFLTDVADEP